MRNDRGREGARGPGGDLGVITNVAERRFGWLARQRGHAIWHEDVLEAVMELRGPRPDFFVGTPAGDFLAEVKSFATAGPLDNRPNRVFTVGQEQLLRPIQGAIDEAAPQLRAYADLPCARVVVLDNWRHVGLSLEDEVLLQVFGELLFVVPVQTGGIATPAQTQLAFGRGRSLGIDKRTYISAVLVTEALEREPRDTFEIERPMRARVLHNPYATVPLAQAAFASASDEHLVYETDRWVRKRGGA